MPVRMSNLKFMHWMISLPAKYFKYQPWKNDKDEGSQVAIVIRLISEMLTVCTH